MKIGNDPFANVLDGARVAKSGAPVITCAEDLIPYVKIPDDSGKGLVPFEDRPYQRNLLKFWEEEQKTCMKKSRRMGATFTYALRALYKCGWCKHQSICSANYTKEQAYELIDRVRILWESLPRSWRPPAKFGEEARFTKSGSIIFCVATRDTSGAGNTITELCVDEAGLIANLGNMWPAISQAASAGKVHLFSTAREATGHFAKMGRDARAGLNGYVYRFLHYSENPKFDAAWKAARIKEIGQAAFDREYEGVETVPGNAYFSAELINALREKVKNRAFKLLMNGRLKSYGHLQSEKALIGVDVAEGLSDGDFSSAHVISNTGRLLAHYHARVSPTQYAEDLFTIGKMYGNAWMAIEANNHGHAVCQWLYYHLKYLKIFRDDDTAKARVGLGLVARLGIMTTAASKPSLLANMESNLRNSKLDPCDDSTVDELSTFINLGGGTYGASPGQHDDRVISLALADYARGRRIPRSA